MPQSWHFLHLAGSAQGVSKEIPDAVLREPEQDRKDASGKIFAISFWNCCTGPAGRGTGCDIAALNAASSISNSMNTCGTRNPAVIFTKK